MDKLPGKPRTALERHVAFWDKDGDGVIWPWDTYAGFRALGYNPLFSLAAVPALHVFGVVTSPTWLINPLLPIYVKNIHRCKHGSDSECYSREGHFREEAFNGMLDKFSGGKDGLNLHDMMRMASYNSDAGDVFGWMAVRGEWLALWLLCADRNGLVSKAKIRGQYDGTLWQQIADERKAAGKHSAQWAPPPAGSATDGEVHNGKTH